VRAWALALIVGLSLPFLGKPVHLDDANFLALAEGARRDFWRPHDVIINWQGTAQPAFEVLSNPPGIAWWLAPVVGAPVWVMHLWMLLWLPLAVWGATRLSSALTGRGEAGAVLLCGAPIAVLAAQSLMPDLPLLACTLAGLGGLVSARPGRRWPFALLAGCAALFRYSGVALIPLVIAWPLLHRDVRGAARCGLAAALPIALLTLHDLHAYGQPHLLAMVGFQGVSDTPGAVVAKLVAALGALGGAAVLPVLCWGRPLRAGIGFVAGAAAGAAMGQSGLPLVSSMLAVGAGGAVLGAALRREDVRSVWLACWLVGGLLFLLKLRFAAARYWLPFFAPALLLLLRDAPVRLVRVAVVFTPVLSLLLALDDLELARAQRAAADRVIAMGTGLFVGHWGWQHHLEAAGWQALEEDAPVPSGVLLARSEIAWPQEAGLSCRTPVDDFSIPDFWPGPRVHTVEGAANLHAFLIAGEPPVSAYAPWGWGGDVLDSVTVVRGCE
jgi:hypothetical protein